MTDETAMLDAVRKDFGVAPIYADWLDEREREEEAAFWRSLELSAGEVLHIENVPTIWRENPAIATSIDDLRRMQIILEAGPARFQGEKTRLIFSRRDVVNLMTTAQVRYAFLRSDDWSTYHGPWHPEETYARSFERLREFFMWLEMPDLIADEHAPVGLMLWFGRLPEIDWNAGESWLLPCHVNAFDAGSTAFRRLREQLVAIPPQAIREIMGLDQPLSPDEPLTPR
jgi:hypothetical protein